MSETVILRGGNPQPTSPPRPSPTPAPASSAGEQDFLATFRGHASHPGGSAGVALLGSPVHVTADPPTVGVATVGLATAGPGASADDAVVAGVVTRAGDAGVVVRSFGHVTLTAAQWDLVTGDLGGLSRGALYWLSPTPGRITRDQPSPPSELVTVGIAVSDVMLLLVPAIAIPPPPDAP